MLPRTNVAENENRTFLGGKKKKKLNLAALKKTNSSIRSGDMCVIKVGSEDLLAAKLAAFTAVIRKALKSHSLLYILLLVTNNSFFRAAVCN